MRVENLCERQFLEGGPFFHLCTQPVEDELLFRNKAELDEALNFIAIAVFSSACSILAFALMSNHIHFILEGSLAACEVFYENLRTRLMKCHRREGRSRVYERATPKFVPINNLKQLRNEIVYVVRNPFVDRTDVNLFSYRWCSGYLYFNDMLELMPEGVPAASLSILDRRRFKHERNAQLSPHIRIHNGTALPSCFTDYKRVEGFFDNARQFVHWTLKNVESQIEIAKRLGESFVLDDSELWSIVNRLCRETYKADSPRALSHKNKVQLMNTLKWDYNASNAQMARCTQLPLSMVNDMFPLSKKVHP